jgi:hypothetical protein
MQHRRLDWLARADAHVVADAAIPSAATREPRTHNYPVLLLRI